MTRASIELVSDSGEGGDCLVDLCGEFDGSSCHEISALAAWFLRSSSSRQLTLDMTAVTFIDGSSLKALLDAQEVLGMAGRRLVLDNVPAPVARVMRITETGSLLSF